MFVCMHARGFKCFSPVLSADPIAIEKRTSADKHVHSFNLLYLKIIFLFVVIATVAWKRDLLLTKTSIFKQEAHVQCLHV